MDTMLYPKISDIEWDVSVTDYRDDFAISYSQLSRFARGGPKYILVEEREETEALLFGSLVDELLTEDNAINNYVFIDFDIPDKIKLIIENLFNLTARGFRYLSDIDKDLIINAANLFEFYPHWKEQTRVNKILEYEKYLEFLGENYNKIILPREMIIDAQKCVEELKTNAWTRDYFVCPQLDKSIELHFQKKFKHNQRKCMFDVLRINHKNKTIQPVDLKTTSSKEDKFNDSFYKWMYFLQSSYYTDILREKLKEHTEFKNYKILPFIFICINKDNLAPLLWVDTKSHSIIDREYKNEVYPSWSRLLKDFIWHLDNQQFKYSREAYENNGIMKLI